MYGEPSLVVKDVRMASSSIYYCSQFGGAAIQIIHFNSMEDEALRSVGLGEEETRRLDVGTRRALRFPLDPEARIEPVDGGYRLHVALPAGAYATVLLAELIKPAEGVVERTEG